MILSELVDAFKEHYKLECFKRNTGEKDFPEKFLALILSEVCSDIQKSFGVLECSLSVTLAAGTDKYNLNASVMTVKDVVLGGIPLMEKSSAWFEKRTALNSTPSYYTMLYLTAIPQIWIYPNPVDVGTLNVNYNANFNLYSPSVVGDFGDFGITGKGYTGNTVFPTQYDRLIILGMLKQIFSDVEPQYMKEKYLLLGKQFNGTSLKDYNMDGTISEGRYYRVRGM